VILQELVLHNFGVYRDRQVLAFAPPTTKRPITLVGGLNGGGKTTILEALHLALYGQLAPVSGRRGLSYEAYLESMVHHGAEPGEGAGVELAFSTQVSGASQTFRIHRSWSVTSERVRERLTVARDGRIDRELTDRWPEQVEAFVPRGVAPFFFFDAEQVESLADLEAASEVLRTAVGALLGLDLVGRLQEDLIVLERRKKSSRASTSIQAEIARLEGEIEELRRTEGRARQEVATARVRVERVGAELGDVETRFRRDGGDLFERRHDLESDRARLAEELRSREGDLRELAAGPACFLTILDQLEAAAGQAALEHEIQRERSLAALLEERDAAVLERLTLHPRALKDVERALREDREARRPRPIELIVDLAAEGSIQLRSLLDATLPQEADRLAELEELRSGLRSQLDLVEQRLAGVPSSDAIDGLVRERDAARGELSVAEAALRDAEGRLSQVEADLADRARRLAKVLEATARERLEGEDASRIVAHAAKVRATLERFRVEATRRHLTRIEALIMESLSQLLRKERLIRGLHLDPATFGFELTGEDGQRLDPRKLSAGERQLLAISMLWGLARSSGRPLPVIIDTPLGRLDATHRVHLIERYFPRASHQVVLLATDDEIDEAAYERLKPYLGRAYELRFDEGRSSTVITEGYFSGVAK